MLVAEDDAGLRSVLQRALRERGYVVDAVGDGERALSFLGTYDYEVAVLDWRMPRASGIDVVRHLRQHGSAVPILMLTARDTAADRVEGLDHGADDYLVKPFDLEELMARIRALQRRSPALASTVLVVGDLVFDPATREVRIGSHALRLTLIETAVLEVLVRRSPAVVSRRSIAHHVWEDEADAVGSNTIDVHVARLRSKLAGAMVRIETVRGVGYRMVPVP